LLLRHLLLPLMVLKGLLLQLRDVLLHGHAILSRIGFDLLPLPVLKLLRRHPALLGLDGDLLLHCCHLLGRGLLARWRRS
jgi:hypothetical protein